MFDNATQLTIIKATLFAYKIPFKSPMQFNNTQLHYREGLILHLKDSQLVNHYVEIAPLPGFSKETLSDVKTEIIKILSTSLKQLSTHKSQYKSIQIALDILFLKDKKSTNRPLADIDCVALLQGNNASISQQYQALGKPNLIKLKVARGPVESDIRIFNTLCQLNPLLKIRCDANQAWDKQQAIGFFSAIDNQRLDYIEEPTSEHQTNLQLADSYHIGLGLDETLQQDNFNYQHLHQIKAFIIKPTLIGSKHKIDHLVSSAQQQAIKISFSSSFESSVGLQTIKKLASHYRSLPGYQNLTISLGIDTLKHFDSAFLVDMRNIEQDIQKLEVLWISN